jgi:signal transduction histidine kinase/CheY-like chemotaxis protein/PAS domain-containing protein
VNAAGRYAIAIAATAVSIALTYRFAELLAPMRLFFLWCSILVTAIVAGVRPALFSVALSILAAAFIVFEPIGSFAVHGWLDMLRMTLFALFATAITLGVGRVSSLSTQLQASEQRYRTLVEATPVPQAVWTASAEGRIRWTKQWTTITGRAVDEAPLTWDRWQQALLTATPYEDELRIPLANGRERWFAVRAVPVLRKDGKVEEWVGILADIHDRKRHEENAAFVNRASAALAASLDRAVTLRTLARLCVPSLGDWCSIDTDTGERFDDGVEPDGAERVVATMLTGGRTIGTLTVAGRFVEEVRPLIEDLARRGAIALDNARLYEAAESANRAKDEFLATLSHELRTPLTAISGWAHMLQLGTDGPTTRLAVETIMRSAKAQGELIDDLLDLSRVVAGTLRLTLTTVDLVKLAEEVLVSARPAAEAKALRVELGVEPGALARPETAEGGRLYTSVLVRGDERRLRQIIWNLVSNAVKFTDHGGRVLVDVGVRGSLAFVEVVDTGRGIDPAFLPYVWDRFRQADSSTSRQHGGLGLGLAVVRHLVNLHGGTVHVESEGAGKGAKFAFEMPLARLDDTSYAAAFVAAHGDELLRARRILVVDDDDDARLVIAAMLRQFGAEVVNASSATTALEALQHFTFDVVVSDIAMPEEDGFALIRRIHATRKIPVIAVSAISSGPEDRGRVMKAGFADFVRKPVEPRQLALAVAAVIP